MEDPMAHNKKKEKENNTTEEINTQNQVEEVVTEEQLKKTEEEIQQPAQEEKVSESVEIEAEKEIQDEPSFTEETNMDIPDEDLGSEDPSLNWWEKILHFEGTSKAGLITAIILLVAVVFSWDWINHTWWLVTILAGVSLRNLHKQRIELDEEKPFEAKVANISFFVTLIILIIRDLVLTNRLDNLIP